MGVPTRGEVEVATDTLREEGGVWLEQAGRMATLSRSVEALRLGRLEAGVFQLFVSPYNAVVDVVTARCAEGESEMTKIGDTLRQVADTYDQEDLDGEHRIRGLY